jgi:hypothetical protein
MRFNQVTLAEIRIFALPETALSAGKESELPVTTAEIEIDFEWKVDDGSEDLSALPLTNVENYSHKFGMPNTQILPDQRTQTRRKCAG